MKDDKTKIKNWIDGDTFAVKIENHSKEYNGRYLILTKKLHPLKPNYDEEYKFFPYVYAKITKERRIPKSIEEINSLNFIKCFVEYFDKDTINIVNIGKDYDKLIPDEFNYLYVYLFSVDFHKKNKDIQNFIYIGNFDITPPKYEIISERTSYICVTTKFNWIGELIDNYKNYNLHEGWEFQIGGLDKMRQNNFMWYNIIKQSDELVENLGENYTPQYSFGWGVGIYDSDVALDIKGSYEDIYKKNKSYEEIMDELKKTIGDYLSHELDGPISWIVLADQEMRRKRLNPELKKIAYKSIEKDLKNWENNELYDERKKVLDKFRNKLDNFKETD